MHIKDYAQAQGWFRKHAAAPSSVGSWKAFVARNNRPQEPRNMAEGGRTGFYKGESVVKSHGDQVVQLGDAGESSRSIAKKLGLKQQTVNDAINSIEKGLAGENYKFSKPFKDIIKSSVNKSGVNLKDPKYTDEVIKFIDDNPTFNQKQGAEILGKKRASLVEAKLWGNPGPKWNDAKAKLRNEADTAWKKKYSDPNLEYKTRGTKKVHRHHAGGLREKVTTENIMPLKAQDNYKNIRPFEKAMDEIQLKQYKNNLNRSLPASKKKLVFEALAKEEAALRAANPKFSPYKSSLIFEESALGKGTFKYKEIMIDPKLTVSEGKTGQKFAFKNATKKETQEIIDLTKKSLLKLGGCYSAGGRVGFAAGSGKCITKALAKLKSGNLTSAEKKIVDAMGDGLKKGGLPKKFWTTAAKGEGYFALADFANNLTKGQSLDKSFSNAIKMASLGLVNFKGTERDLMKYAKERGLDTEAMKEWMDYAQTYGKYAKAHEDQQYAHETLVSDEISMPEDIDLQQSVLDQSPDRIKKLEGQIQEKQKAESIQSGKGYKALNEAIEGVVAKEWNKPAGIPGLDRGYRKMLGMKGDEGLVWGPVGTLFREGAEKLGFDEHKALKSFKPQKVMNYHPAYGYKEDIKDVIREGDSPMEDMLEFMKKFYPSSALNVEAARDKLGTYDYDPDLLATGGIASLKKK